MPSYINESEDTVTTLPTKTCDVNAAVRDVTSHGRLKHRVDRRALSVELAAERRWVGAALARLDSYGVGVLVILSPFVVLFALLIGYAIVRPDASTVLILPVMLVAGMLSIFLGTGLNGPASIRLHHMVTWPVLVARAGARNGAEIDATLAPYRAVLPGRRLAASSRQRVISLTTVGIAAISVGVLGAASDMALQSSMLIPGVIACIIAGTMANARQQSALAIDAALAGGCTPDAVAEAAVRSTSSDMFSQVLDRMHKS
jgi:hypothetical protein